MAAVVLLLSVMSTVYADEPSVDYVTQIKPLLAKHCVGCHGAQKQQVGLRVDTARGLLDGGDSGPALIPKESAKSLLIHAITGTEGASQMPPKGEKLNAAEIAIIRRWIDEGAISPAAEVAETAAAKTSDHWSFKPISRGAPPIVAETRSLRNGIDNFISQRLADEGLTPSPEAELTTQLRRVHLDLLGVPPTVETIREFLADQSPDAYERLVDRLLASPHYGERWGRDWLDAARYADSNGFTRDQPRTIWKYRDWVINALNDNLPFDQFTIEQIAGDLLPKPTLDQLVATGFHRNTLINEEGGTDPEQFRVEAVVDRVNTTGAVFLGLTIGCAQCHDHKYDPISQREYYQLYAFFNSTEFIASDPAEPKIDVPSLAQFLTGEPERKAQIRSEISRLEKELKDQAANIALDLAAWEETLSLEDKKKLPFNVKNALDLPLVDRSDVHKRDLDGYFRAQKIARDKYPQLDEIGRLRESEPKFPTTMITREISKPRTSHIHIRGDFLRPGAAVEPAVPAVLNDRGRLEPNVQSNPQSPTPNPLTPTPLPARPGRGAPVEPAVPAVLGAVDVSATPVPQDNTIANRLRLAQWLVSFDNPLTARVVANRYWQRFFGRGLVETESDFGIQGDRPTHPELLDWIASEFRGAAWNDLERTPSAADSVATARASAARPRSWDVKHLHRLFVTSATYRQSSNARSDLSEVDPLNKLLARQSRIRIDAEMIRDLALTASGLLTEELGGAPVNPPQPEGVFDFTQDKKPWKTSTGRERFRKAMYTQLWRSSLYPAMAVFDFPDPNVTCTRRIRSNTPLQSLTLANDEAFFEFGQGFAVKLLNAATLDDSQKLSVAVETALGREPTSTELARLRAYLQQQRERFTNDPAAAASFAPKNLPQGTAVSEAAAWVAVSRVLMNLDEFITRE